MNFTNWLTYTEDVEVYINSIKVKNIAVPKKLLNDYKNKSHYFAKTRVISYIKDNFKIIEDSYHYFFGLENDIYCLGIYDDKL